MKIFSSEKRLLQHSVLGYNFDLYFPQHKLAIEIDEQRHKDRDKHKEIVRQKVIQKELDCKFIRINPDEQNFHMDIHISRIENHIAESSRKSRHDFKKTIRTRISVKSFNKI